MDSPIEVDVLIVGAGPVGLSIASQLLRFHRATTVYIVEKHPKPQQEAFGRAVTFWPRSMEMLEQVGLADAITEQCFAVRASAAYDARGQEVFGRGWSFLEGIEDTRYKFATVLRQKYVEEIFRAQLDQFGVQVQAPAAFESLEVDENVPVGGQRVTATILDESGAEPQRYKVKCKYLIGCDGSRTAVRGAAGIESDGDRTEDKWVRIDGVLSSTTMPKPRCYGAIESPVYGNVLWIPLDHGATRIGYALNEERMKIYGAGKACLTRAAFIAEAKEAVKPFEIEFERVDWASIYSVGQRVARHFGTQGCVFLAGDSCHTHSSGAGQGMNAGQHDACNLSWKLSLVLQGIAKPELLETYELERRPNAQKLIKYDEDISVLVSGRLPKSWKGDQTEDPHVVLGKILQEAKGFNTGLTIGYEPNLAVVREETLETNGHTSLDDKNAVIPAAALPGYRGPDVKLLLPALHEPTWLYQLTPNRAQFHVLVFTGDTERNKKPFQSLKKGVEASPLLSGKPKWVPHGGDSTPFAKAMNDSRLDGDRLKSKTPSLPVQFLTIVLGAWANAWHVLGTNPLGRILYDGDGSAHRRYGVPEDQASLFLLRPDGWIGAKYDIGIPGVVERIEEYLGGILYT